MTAATENRAEITVQLLSATGPKGAVYALLRQLRPDYSQNAMSEQINKQQSQGYQLAYVERHGEVVAVAGFYIGEKLAWGKHLYVDDLVTSDQHRSAGMGKRLLDWLKQYAISQHCQQLHLDSGVQRFTAHKFYLREGFKIASHHFSMAL